MRVVAVANQKGGCGKTTTSINLAACLAYLGKRVLLVDLDPQGHSTCGLGVSAGPHRKTVYNLLYFPDGCMPAPEELLCPVNSHLSLIPSYENLSFLDEILAHRKDRETRLREALAGFRSRGYDWDYVVLDCPPNLGVLTYNALAAAQDVIIPVEPSFFSLHGLAKISETIQRTRETREVPLEVHALLTLFRSENSFFQEIYGEVKKHFRDRLFKTSIHEDILLREASSAGQSIVDYQPKSQAFRDYLNLATEYLEREWQRLLPEKALGWDHVMSLRFGPRSLSGGVLFQLMSRSARSVEIAGDFNQWIPESLVCREQEGLWQKVIPVTHGGFRYKFIVDGEWQVDPYQPVQLSNAFGGYDSYLEIA
ncbi:MAG: AAA family ATPase [Candidatus Omnitrophota bacterium]|jgi:chromosome partitioning protein